MDVSVLCLFLLQINFIFGNPQLDLPQLTTPSSKPQIYLNSYSSSQSSGGALYGDEDRSSRGGPPYGDLNDDIVDNRPQFLGNNEEQRSRQGGYNPAYYDNIRDRVNPYTNSSASPFSVNPSSRVPFNPDQYNRNGGVYNDDRYNREQYQNDRNQDTGRLPNDRNPYTSERNPYTNDRNPYFNDRYPDSNPNDRNPYSNDRLSPDQIEDERFRLELERKSQIEMEKLRNFLTESDHKGSMECTANVASQWNFETNVNDVTQAEALLAQEKYSEFQRLTHEISKNINKNLIFDDKLFRQLQLLSQVGQNALPIDQLDRYNRLINEMLALYQSATTCAYESPFHCGLRLNPELKDIMATSRDWEELQFLWQEYHRKAGRPMQNSFEQLIDVVNEIAFANNFTNGGDYWYSAYDSPNFRDEVEAAWQQVRPLYENLHAYVRRKLREYYGPDKIHRHAPIPSHILGNMFGQTWTSILDIIIPYPGRSFVDVTPKMIEQGYTPPVMFQLANEFFASINMTILPPEFWQNSIIAEPLDRVVSCQPAAWDFCNRHDFRIKMCTKVNHRDFVTVHHEMSHIQYFLNYRPLPKVFRDGANPAFHQAVGDAIALSVSTPKYLQTLGLLQKSVDDTPYDINYLFAMAADKVAFLPYALAVDNWRYDLFSGRARKHMMNCHFWDLREQYGGIKPPVLRSEMDFDAGAKYHVAANVPYIKYFVSTILQFQIYRAMCRASNQYNRSDPRRQLHKCDIFRQPEAGNLLKRIMEKGASQPWQRTLDEAIGENRLDGSALREYFAPLEEWLRLENLRNNEIVGWNYDGDYCKRSIETANLQVSGGYYNGAERRDVTVALLVFAVTLVFSVKLIFNQ